jgi:histidine ammonia-lyase
MTIGLSANPLTDWQQLYWGSAPATVILSEEAIDAIASSHRALESLLATGEPVYGVNTGFGRLASQRIGEGDLAALQQNLVLSHSIGVGDPLSEAVVRLALAMKIAALAKGASGVRPVVVQTLIDMVAKDVLPVVPAKVQLEPPAISHRSRTSPPC